MAVQNNKTEGTVLLEMKHVKKSFDKSGVLKDISLKVREGQVVSIIGPSGSGKSTLLRCATLLEKMDAGELIYLGEKAAWEQDDKKGKSAVSTRQRISLSRFVLISVLFSKALIFFRIILL